MAPMKKYAVGLGSTTLSRPVALELVAREMSRDDLVGYGQLYDWRATDGRIWNGRVVEFDTQSDRDAELATSIGQIEAAKTARSAKKTSRFQCKNHAWEIIGHEEKRCKKCGKIIFFGGHDD